MNKKSFQKQLIDASKYDPYEDLLNKVIAANIAEDKLCAWLDETKLPNMVLINFRNKFRDRIRKNESTK